MSSTTNAPFGPETTTGKTTVFQALTTTFTPPAECKSAFVWEDRLVGYDPGYGVSVDTDLTCGPGAWTTWWMQGQLGNGETRISIGPMTCPHDWTTVATSTRSESSTLAMCCPSGYHLTSGTVGEVEGDCVSDVRSGMTLTYMSSDSARDTYATETTTLDRRSTVGAIALLGWNIDSATATSTSMTSSTTNSMTTSTSTTASASQTSDGSGSGSSSNSNSNSDSDSGGLSSGAKAGIGIGVGVGGIGVIALLVALWMFRRRKSNKTSPPSNPNPPVTQPPNPSQPPTIPPPVAQPPPATGMSQQQQWYNPPGAIVPPSNSDHFPSSASQASGAIAGGALHSSEPSHAQSETIISSASPTSNLNLQHGGSTAHHPPQLDPVEIPAGSAWISELQGSMHHPAETHAGPESAPGTQARGGERA